MRAPIGRLAAVLPFALVLLLFAAPPPAAATGPAGTASPGSPIARAIVGSHDLCGVDVAVTNNGRFTTLYSPQSPDAPFEVTAGLWVGAVADRGDGSGPQPYVSSGYFQAEFWPPDAAPGATIAEEPARAGAAAVLRPADVDPMLVHTLYRDTFTADFLPDHRPLGLEVVQESFPVLTRDEVHWVDVKYTIRNISDVFAPPGWTLENVALGILVDPDVGQGEDLYIWEDDLGGFASAGPTPGPTVAPGARRGDLAYLFDAPGNGDDVDTQFGVVLRGRPVHAFRIWSSGAQDPTSDADRYARLLGAADGSPRIDPPPGVPADYRFLISTGVVGDLAPGESTTFGISMACGALVPDAAPQPAAELVLGPPDARDRVVSRAAGPVRFGDDPGAVDIFAVDGRRVARVEGASGWDFRTRDGGVAPAGVYFWRRVEGAQDVAGKIVLTR